MIPVIVTDSFDAELIQRNPHPLRVCSRAFYKSTDATKKKNTRILKEALRYKLELGHSLERTSMVLKIFKSVVARYVAFAKAEGLPCMMCI